MVETIEDAVQFVGDLFSYCSSSQEEDVSEGIRNAIVAKDTPTLFAHLTKGLAFQGISDAIARQYADDHGHADWHVIEALLAKQIGHCSKLASFDHFLDCRYKKSKQTCSNPDLLPGCPVSRLPLRKGILNEQAFSLYLLIRDRCAGDLVGYIDDTLAIASLESDSTTIGREALLALLTSVRGVSRKVASMMLATVLISADPGRPRWHDVGQSMVAIDSLVHNFLHRTGIVKAYQARHAYGQLCFGLTGCEAVIRNLANRLTIQLAEEVPPRALQHAIWRFCATGELDICNGRRINDDGRCAKQDCPLRSRCSRWPLRSVAMEVAP